MNGEEDGDREPCLCSRAWPQSVVPQYWHQVTFDPMRRPLHQFPARPPPGYPRPPDNPFRRPREGEGAPQVSEWTRWQLDCYQERPVLRDTRAAGHGGDGLLRSLADLARQVLLVTAAELPGFLAWLSRAVVAVASFLGRVPAFAVVIILFIIKHLMLVLARCYLILAVVTACVDIMVALTREGYEQLIYVLVEDLRSWSVG